MEDRRLNKSGSKGKVFVGMSGGVDSSVSAYLLQKEGYAVTGVFIKTWSPEWMPCTWKEERLDAMRVTVHLGIPLLTLDGVEEYKNKVAEYMIKEYEVGLTPNPDFFCNNYIKFGLFYDYAVSQGADFVATGHYAQVKIIGGPTSDSEFRRSDLRLLSATDKSKDQSYFLAGIKKERLSKILFPIGHLLKSEVREIARKAKLPVAKKKDSQGLCFIGQVNMDEFLSHYIKPEQGSVLDENGSVVGTHNEAKFVTLGQRHGFHITDKKLSGQELYVLAKDITNNTITVGVRFHLTPDKDGLEISLRDLNWFVEPEDKKEYSCQCRYHQKHITCKVIAQGSLVHIQLLETPSDPPTPGQICVIFENEQVVGSGVIM